ncbi:PPOX class F420-dependent oxidoreductase [Catelliglobosispora koreensis]|uniref:PPOX class F420-dependent oxidoreductase n=1 Tax=Catelliglobosispora koreensis TaxID=129052 RepID=UPI00037D1826|nr:TIGR03618 family F420-dependent PPOX class oxidoreductase [Catelliglobosispora koreensis]
MTALSDSARKLIDETSIAILATLNPDGSPQGSVVWVGRRGDDVVISSQAGRRKERNLRRDPRASLTIVDAADPSRYLEVRGTATVSVDVGRQLAVELAEKYEGEGAGDEYLALPPEDLRVTITLTPNRILGSAA